MQRRDIRTTWPQLLGFSLAIALPAYLFASAAGALFGATAGVLLWWGWTKDSVAQTLAGAVKGIIFVALIGPVADWMVSRQPISEKLPLALISGGLLGAALGVKNARPPKATVSHEASAPGSGP